MKQIDLREGARRQHRAVALFAVIQCWLRGLDGIAFDRRQLERLIGLERFKGARVAWLKEDFKEFFPHVRVFLRRGTKNSLAGVIIARVSLQEVPRSLSIRWTLGAAKRKVGLKLDMFELWREPGGDLNEVFEGLVPFFADKANFDERFLASYLALLAQGQVSPRNLPSPRDEPDEE